MKRNGLWGLVLLILSLYSFAAIALTNSKPVATPQAISLAEDSSKEIVLTGTDIEDGNAVTALLGTTSALNGTLVAVAGKSNTYLYTPKANFNGNASFTFTVKDSANLVSTAVTVSIVVQAVADSPVAQAQAVSMTEDIAAKSIVLTALDVDSTSFTYAIATPPAHGTIVSLSGATVVYKPALNYFGTDSFTFTAKDTTNLTSAPATVSLAITPVNDNPVALAQAVTLDEDSSKEIVLTGTDIEDGNAVTALLGTTSALNGTLVAVAGKSNTYLYTPKANFNGNASFTFTVKDSANLVSTAVTVSIVVQAVADSPVAQAQAVSMTEDIAAKSIVLTALDVDSTSFTYAIATPPAHGTIVSLSGATVVYKPALNYFGTDSFTFTAKDTTNLTSAPATVSLAITPVNDNPVALAQAVTLDEDSSKEIVLTGTDIEDGNAVTALLGTTSALNGTLVAVAGKSNTYLYTPKANFNGNASFTFTVKDSANLVSTAVTVSIVVQAVADSPVAQAQAVSMTEDIAAKSIVLTALDVDSTSFTYAIATPPAHGTIVSLSGATVVYKPALNYFGTDSFTFTAKDTTNLTSAPATVSLAITPVNDKPVALTQAVTVVEDSSKEIVLTGTDIEDGSAVTALLGTTSALNGTLVAVAGKSNTYLYTPKANFNGNASFTFTVKDSANLVSTAVTVSIVVQAVADSPVAQAQVVSMTEDIAAKSIVLTALDVDSTSFTYAIATPPAHGTIVSLSGATVVYKPALNYVGTDSFTFTAKDTTNLTSAPATVSLTITPVNDRPVAEAQRVFVAATGTTTITLQGTDVDGDLLTYLLSTPAALGTVKLPTGFGTVAGVNTLEYTPKAGVTTDAIMFNVKDASLTSTPAAKISISVVSTANNRPTANAGSDLFVPTNTSVTLLGSGNDLDNDTLSYRWLQGTMVKATTASYTFTTPSVAADQTYTLEVNDGKGGIATDTVSLMVRGLSFTDINLRKCFGDSVPSDAALLALTTFTCDGIDLSTADLSQLAQLPNLRTVDLSHTKLVDISALASLTKLTQLNLQFNDIASISSLAGMKQLQYLNLGFNEISDISALSGMNSLQELYLDANKLSVISPLAGKTTLTKLYLDDNQISSIAALSGLTNLTHLGLGYNQISSVGALSSLSALQVLVLDANNLASVSELGGLTTLQYLFLRGNALADAMPLSGLSNLQTLELGFNQITSASPLSNLTNLTRLGLEYNNLENVNALSGMTMLKTLDLEHNQLVSAAGVPNMSALNGLLRLEGNLLLDDDVMPLSTMSNSYSMLLEDNCVASVTFPTRIKAYGIPWQFKPARCGGSAPVAYGKTSEIYKGTATTIQLDALDPNDDALTYRLESIAVVGGVLKKANGAVATVGIVTPNEVRFVPNSTYLGSGGYFTFSATDSNGEKSQVVTVQIRVIDPLLGSCFTGSIPSDAELQALTRLDCVGKNLEDISALSFYFPNLDTLVLNNNQLSDISLLNATNFPHLIRLNLSGNPLDLSDLTMLSNNLPSLIMLFLDDAALDNDDLVALLGTAANPKLRNLNYLMLRNNQITSIDPLLNLRSMSTLGLDNNNITSLTGLSPALPAALPMPSLAELSVEKNRLSNIALPRLSGLSYLQAANNCLSSAPVVRTTPTPLPNVYWTNQRTLVNGVCPAYTP
ncbi:tandem-95 repeat protein [Thiothrix lacustris]|uniref:tandem-95 repeat protein n=1 Tax=Thiothrix lacustris TaxID=525917 RepID=UPI0027E5923A|nr:Ig-like domain-containing protein [Thiothrix lacustris]WMP16279.1 Ig-like domain-containing protein [Thiothrix lacustris]